MKIMIISSSPNTDGLTAACVHAAQLGVEKEGFETIQIRLNDLNIGRCHACGNGWGTCLDRHECQVLDDFQKLHQSMADIDGYIIITPVYWGEMSESAKAFFDRLRRCEATKRDKNYIEGKPIIAVAAGWAQRQRHSILPCFHGKAYKRISGAKIRSYGHNPVQQRIYAAFNTECRR